MKATYRKRIGQLREQMCLYHTDAYLISGSDPHLSEYPAECWKTRQWLSGFTGSAGTLVITTGKAGLWTDSRYFLQAEEQLSGTGIELFKAGLPDTPSITDFLLDELDEKSTVGLDGQVYSVTEIENLQQKLYIKQLQLITSHDLINTIWTDRPQIPSTPIFELSLQYSGKNITDKLKVIREELCEQNANSIILSALDEVAWTFNIRGKDVDFNPVAISYAFISPEEAILFIDPRKVPDPLVILLAQHRVSIRKYEEIFTYLTNLPATSKIFIDPATTNIALQQAIPEACEIKTGISPVKQLKSIKNPTEIQGFRNAVIKDGIALTRFYIWLEKKMAAGEQVTELSAANKLSAFRAEQEGYLMDSFQTISGYAAHGAIVHYSVTSESDTVLEPESLYLIDSGAQYLDGTTDITRTIALGEPTGQMKKDFTRVLKGMISLSKCRFPTGTRGSQLDILARKALWDAGIQYLHGTGHGIGHCLNVHEGPQSIRMEENPVSLKPGMVISNEPAMYRTGEYGIRTENMILVREDSKTEFGEFLDFETLTLCYIDKSLIILPMLSAREQTWLNKYHQKVYDLLSPHLNKEEQEWLKEKTDPIEN
ncbi:MAG: aminopeptidase P family protein [Tannerellaceae bacterium]|nr:aminopeptidase P family protein [Tannerellaceae bacterium]